MARGRRPHRRRSSDKTKKLYGKVTVRQLLLSHIEGDFTGLIIDPETDRVLIEFPMWAGHEGEAVELEIRFYPAEAGEKDAEDERSTAQDGEGEGEAA